LKLDTKSNLIPYLQDDISHLGKREPFTLDLDSVCAWGKKRETQEARAIGFSLPVLVISDIDDLN
jgi:hypothetical protein